MEKVSILVYSTEDLSEEFLQSLEENSYYISEVLIYKEGVNKSFQNFDTKLPIKFLYGSKGEAQARKTLLSSTSEELVLFLKDNYLMEEDFLEELVDAFLETKADVVYPNLIFRYGDREEIKNYMDHFGQEYRLLYELAIEDFLPDWAVLGKRKVFKDLGGFFEEFGDFCFYEFLYRNIKNIRLKLSKFTYAIVDVSKESSFIDTSYRSYALKKSVLSVYDWQKDIFPYLSWDKNPDVAKATALTFVGERFYRYFDYLNASDVYRKALMFFDNKETFRRLISTYIEMGLFTEVKKLLEMESDDFSNLGDLVENLAKLVGELEDSIKKGKIEEVWIAIQDVAKVYKGAPIHNLLGVLNWIKGNKRDAYRFFYKAVTMNPLNKDFLFNLSIAAKELSKENDVKALIDRLLWKLGEVTF